MGINAKYRVLILEDEALWCNLMAENLKGFAENAGVSVEVDIAHDAQNFLERMSSASYHAVSIDLRLPEKTGGPLTARATGIELVRAHQSMAPMTWAHIYTAYAYDHVLEMYRETAASGLPALPLWEKAISDNEGERRFTQKEWAEAVLAHLLPGDAARRFADAKARERLQPFVKQVSPLGAAMDFALAAGQQHLPEGLAKSCALIHKWVSGKQSEAEWLAFLEALYLTETVQHWLWVQASAWLLTIEPKRAVSWPAGEGRPTRQQVERSLGGMVRRIAELDRSDWSATWLSHLNASGGDSDVSITGALAAIREVRNRIYHRTTPENLANLWGEIAEPLRIVLDAAAFLAAFPVVREPRAAADGRWRFDLLKGEGTPLPTEEFILDGGELGGRLPHFSPDQNDVRTLYQVWPGPDGRRGLLKLWPFAEQRGRPNERFTPWLLYGLGSKGRLWERSALDGRERVAGTDDPRWQKLASLKP